MIEKMNILLINKEDDIQQMLIKTIRRWRSNFIAVTGAGLSVVIRLFRCMVEGFGWNQSLVPEQHSFLHYQRNVL